ncbi:hypothetical protein [Frateuria terrea]|uniref:Uncharacterized protein n=1 Tax=Frateuria terrea TaxID=529704 RepID=A0A1H6SUT5_9GAMM|nr:hypothetical protein [Frateuria terrea]SEI67780.1 hypothetical protein SAMN04487997_1432 [Frateuria terrea]SFP26794.1 hypothetical protein SAMN02927913_1347 [Frateuria terrea]
MTPPPQTLRVQQVNAFYNYTVGLDVTNVDLTKTAGKLLKSGLARTVCFSDLKAVYLDEDGAVRLEWLRPEGRAWDNQCSVKFSDTLPQQTVGDLAFCLELSFLERRIEAPEVKHVPPYLRAALPPVVLEDADMSLPVYPWLKLHADGIMCISFQLDTIWDDLGEHEFIRDVVNLFQRYFDRVWVHADIQRLDAEELLPRSFEAEISLGGHAIEGRKTRKLVKKMRQEARSLLDRSLAQDGRIFDLGSEAWELHQVVGSENLTTWEATIDLCRSMYTSALVSEVVARSKTRAKTGAHLWQGRPSISLMRFADQPKTKEELFSKNGPSLARVLMRSATIDNPPLPCDLRPFEDYSFHGNRGLLLWTWLRQDSSPEDAWQDPNTKARVLENQARAEHFEYHNMRVARACAMASAPLSDEHLVQAYETLAMADAVIHQSSQAGEITDALGFLMSAAGTRSLVESAKEQARWHLDERRYRNEKRRSRVDRWLAAVFGFVGAAGLADLVVKPFLHETYSSWLDWQTGLVSFGVAAMAVGLTAALIGFAGKVWTE